MSLGGVGRAAREAEDDGAAPQREPQAQRPAGTKPEMELVNSVLCSRLQVGTEGRTGGTHVSPPFSSPAQELPCEQLMRLMQMGTVSYTTYRCPSHNDGHLLLPFIFLAIISSTNNN